MEMTPDSQMKNFSGVISRICFETFWISRSFKKPSVLFYPKILNCTFIISYDTHYYL